MARVKAGCEGEIVVGGEGGDCEGRYARGGEVEVEGSGEWRLRWGGDVEVEVGGEEEGVYKA